MLLKTRNNRIRSAFSSSAMQYEAEAGLQREIAQKLAERIKAERECRYILDVGMGTGWLTNRLGLLFPQAQVFGLDFAGGMIKSARHQYDTFQIVQADAAALPFRDNLFDIVISNLVYQWVEDLEAAFEQSHASLKQDGIFSLSMFGRKTLEELFLSLEKSFLKNNGENGNGRLLVKRLPELNEVVRAAEKAGFKNIEAESEIIKVPFKDMMTLVKWIKNIGANAVRKDIYIGRDGLFKANEYYNRNFKNKRGVYASFEVIWVKAKR